MLENIRKTFEKYKTSIWKFVLLILVIIGLSIFWYANRSVSPIPSDIQKQLTFSPFVMPTKANSYSTTDYKITTAENQVQTLLYVLHLKNGNVTVSEQSQPPEFAEIPEYKDRFLNNVAKQYGTVQTSNGIIYLGRQTLQDNRQLGIILERGLLIFLNPDKDVELNDNQWRSLGDNLEIQKINN